MHALTKQACICGATGRIVYAATKHMSAMRQRTTQTRMVAETCLSTRCDDKASRAVPCNNENGENERSVEARLQRCRRDACELTCTNETQ
eukprot:2242098-Pleurochrysis_carterae.AAC.1